VKILQKLRSLLLEDADPSFSGLEQNTSMPARLTGQGRAAVIPFPARIGAHSASLPDASLSYNPVPVPSKFRGTLDLEEVNLFLNGDWFAQGRNTGAYMKSVEALERDKKMLTSQFRNILETLIERRREKKKRIQYEEIVAQGTSNIVTQQLRLCIDHLDAEIEIFQAQSTLSFQEAGWVKAVIDQFESGFLRGLQDALSFELLSAR
jgi:hypothetical protein